MSTYAIGDIQGCFDALQALLRTIQFDEKTDTLWCTGDLVNRGPQSLAVLRFFKGLGDRHQVVLGNHDLHFIGVAYQVRATHAGDTLQDLLAAPDREVLLDWLCTRPLLVHDAALGYTMTHAGLAPQWSLRDAGRIAKEVETLLQGKSRALLLKEVFGNVPDYWDESLAGMDRLRSAINFFTRMRFCYPDGRLNFTYKGALASKPADIIPWFDVKPRLNADLNLIFGHWAALNGQADKPHLFPLDTGCVWGNCLTAMRLEDGKRFSVAC
jgi:bis(5'-nucleosyl)-tetraphosphatase (symmetrical)